MKQLNLFSNMPDDISAKTDSKSVRPDASTSSAERQSLDSFVSKQACPESIEGIEGHSLVSKAKPKKTITGHWVVFIDGASRNNPGPAGAGIYIIKDGEEVFEYGYYLGKKTNNQAEYLAAVFGLYHIREAMQSGETVRLVSDSELVVKQLRGIYKVRHPELKPLHQLALVLVGECNARVEHVLRTENVEADRMANQGVNNKTRVPEYLVSFLQNHGITL